MTEGKSARALFWMAMKEGDVGLERVRRGLMKRSAAFNRGLRDAVQAETEALGKLVNDEFAPHYTGSLKSTAQANMRETDYFISGRLSYGGPANSGNLGYTADTPVHVNYAYAIHEDPAGDAANHSGYKFLERGLAHFSPGYAQRLRERLRGKV